MRVRAVGRADGASVGVGVGCPAEAVGFGIGNGSIGDSGSVPGAGIGESAACALPPMTPP